MEPVKSKTKEFATLEAYAHDTHGSTHSYYQTKVVNAFRVERQGETDAWMKAGYDKLADGDRLLLWHGSRTTNFAGLQSLDPYV
jgi:poly [ADP-ribose] polymerase